ncbi:MAG TPA: TrmH family RNA methyltransferase [Anaeromyxobacteraceae bacterium]|nr:TrmH family RNA methyltransferase [Anaeromyxobacteraceae bacterium]
MDLANVTFLLHRPSSGENIGAAARAMKNFGLGHLAIVAPSSWEGLARSGGPARAGDEVLSRARKMARRAGDVLGAAAIHAGLSAALAPVFWACGTSSRAVEGRSPLSPRELAREVAARSDRGKVVIVFGEERNGLSDSDLSLCQATCRIPTCAAYDSMNLAHAVAVLAYEIGLVASADAPTSPSRDLPEPARHRTIEVLWSRTAALLGTVGYLNPQNPDHILDDWRKLLTRAEPTQREVELVVAAIRALERACGPGAAG